jgi:membrane fusion protein (multidrug efflux system)
MNSFSARTVLAGTGILLAGSLLFAPKLFSSGPEKKTPGNASGAAAPVAADNRVASDLYVIRATIIDDALQTTGTLNASQEVDLVSEVPRKLTGILVREGSTVRQGALLFKLDDADLLARKKKLQLQEKLAVLDEKRFRELLATESVNQQEYDQVLTHLQVLQAEIEAVNVDLAKTEIRAPFSGKVGLKKVDIGAYVTPSTVLTTLHDVSRLEIRFTVPERYASIVQVGQPIRFQTETSNLPFEARVTAVEPKTDLHTRSLLVKAMTSGVSGKLVAGTSAKIEVPVHRTGDGILIPTQALVPTPQGYAVIVLKQGLAAQRDVKTGNRTKRLVQILDGLSIGDTVVTTNLLRIAPGVPVKAATIE